MNPNQYSSIKTDQYANVGNSQGSQPYVPKIDDNKPKADIYNNNTMAKASRFETADEGLASTLDPTASSTTEIDMNPNDYALQIQSDYTAKINGEADQNMYLLEGMQVKPNDNEAGDGLDSNLGEDDSIKTESFDFKKSTFDFSEVNKTKAIGDDLVARASKPQKAPKPQNGQFQTTNSRTSMAGNIPKAEKKSRWDIPMHQ